MIQGKFKKFELPKQDKKAKVIDIMKERKTLSELRSYGVERGLTSMPVIVLHRQTFMQ